MSPLKKRGPRHSPGEKHLMAQVAKVFRAKKEEKGGARRAAKELGMTTILVGTATERPPCVDYLIERPSQVPHVLAELLTNGRG